MHRSLIVRLIGLSLLLLLLVQAAGFAVVRASIERNARGQIARELDIDENIWRHLLEQNADRLRQGAALLAADYGFRSAVTSGDAQTIQSVLENHGARIGASVTALLDPGLQLSALSASDDAEGFKVAALAVAVPLARQEQPSQLAVVGGKLYQFVLVPLRVPVVAGWVLMGFPIAQPLAEEMRQLLSLHVAIVVNPGSPGATVPVSTLAVRALGSLRQGATQAVQELETPAGTLIARASALPVLGGAAQALLMRSVDDVVAPYRQLQVLLAEGNYDAPIDHTERRDEIGLLARSFDRMREDIGARQEEIRRLAYWDRLTGLPNRERFREAVVRAIDEASRSDGGEVAILILDLDRFKHVNDVLGYALGDQLLRAVAQRLGSMVQAPGCMVARLGGNEFAILLGDPHSGQAMALAQQIQQSFEAPLAMGEQAVDLSAGIGFAYWPADAQDADILLSRSEIAMYAAKRAASGVLRYAPALDSASAQTLSLLSELRRAVEQDELRLYLQPKVPLQGGQGAAAEALVRWQHPERGLVPPMEFIPFAEQTGFVHQLTLWMLEQVARLLARPEVRVLVH